MSAALLLVLLQLASQGAAPRVDVERGDGGELWSVHTDGTTLDALLARIAQLSGHALEAGPELARAPRVALALERRPLAEVLEYALGTAGLVAELEGRALCVRPEAREREARVLAAEAAWSRLAERHPTHPHGARARLAQGELAELGGRAEAAHLYYLELLRSAPASDAAREAYLRAGRLAGKLGRWDEAATLFRALAELPGADEQRAPARLELAHATLRRGDARAALRELDALDAELPCWTSSELSARALVRLAALVAEGRGADALELSERLEPDLHPLARPALARLRAQGLEAAGLAGEASRAWLLVAREAPAAQRSEAYQAAARLAEEAGDPLAVLYVAREAERDGLAAPIEAAARRARDAWLVSEHTRAAAPVPARFRREDG
ncbi:MAG TPA: hypothetical protein VF530_23930 [Planctomycetota bacterium]